jgi:hypothetical protein
LDQGEFDYHGVRVEVKYEPVVQKFKTMGKYYSMGVT